MRGPHHSTGYEGSTGKDITTVNKAAAVAQGLLGTRKKVGPIKTN